MNVILAIGAKEPSCPACSRYDFEERLLERVLRNELAIETMLKEIRETNVNVESALTLMKDDRKKLEATLDALEKSKNEMDAGLKETLDGGLKNMSNYVAHMEQRHEDMESKLYNAINIGMTNISEAVSDLTQNASITISQIHKENAILKGMHLIQLWKC
ncbi:hypothetical protein DPMN_143402 [Dreissena polymorpha]|uniref:Uncharacterized protein n=1 Tax=Dreissena polymorpha TaxID=45954 RepID=A0A9D4GD27_DREPO|nr:hypothetical protein DPMN_143402 [Dreissena polymorpha]